MNLAMLEPKKISPKELVTKLREEATKNPCMNAVCHIFALRERARQTVTVNGLRVAMAREGFVFTRTQYEEVLKFLSSLGIGTLDFDLNQRIKALTQINVTLQSIGLTAVSKKSMFDKYVQTPIFNKLTERPEDFDKYDVYDKNETPVRTEPRYSATLIIKFEDKPVSFDLPKGLSAPELIALIAQWNAKKSAV